MEDRNVLVAMLGSAVIGGVAGAVGAIVSVPRAGEMPASTAALERAREFRGRHLLWDYTRVIEQYGYPDSIVRLQTCVRWTYGTATVKSGSISSTAS